MHRWKPGISALIGEAFSFSLSEYFCHGSDVMKDTQVESSS
jgi:hypothetical protein